MDLKLPEKRVFLGPAGIWKRILALILDLLVLDLLVVGFFRDVMTGMVGDTSDVVGTYRLLEESETTIRALSMVFMMIMLLVLAYFVLLQYTLGQTIGCILLNIHVVQRTHDEGFERPGFWQCIVRNLFLVPTIPFILLWVADPVYLFFAKKGQRLTEWITNTQVVERYEI